MTVVVGKLIKKLIDGPCITDEWYSAFMPPSEYLQLRRTELWQV
jgi:hypothetical protein